ncbi:MAG: hypothetical protein B6244_07240 [Candidatus Cloacimonetes bacterium 4572_55]|nr:MAG: hypothetical protein B6244_07240 [Candidatus Cloacimonetes bacterium 4572_55]
MWKNCRIVIEDRKYNVKKKYVISDKLGSGGMADVFLAEAEDQQGGKFALKQLLPEYRKNENIKRYLRMEADIASNFSHRHVIKVHHYGENKDGDFCIVMEYIEGGYTLDDQLQELKKSGEQMKPEEIKHYMLKICEGLRLIHELARPGETVVHRDLKPRNILLDKKNPDEENGKTFPRVVITDFGISHEKGGGGSLVGAGTAGYMAPELMETELVKDFEEERDEDATLLLSSDRATDDTVIFDSRSHSAKTDDLALTRVFDLTQSNTLSDTNHPKIDHRADIYALGVILHEMVYNEKPEIWKTGTSPATSSTKSTRTKTASSSFLGRFGTKERVKFRKKGKRKNCRKFDPIIEKLLSVDPDDRYQSASEVVVDLEKKKDRVSPLSVIIMGIVGILLAVSIALMITKEDPPPPIQISTTIPDINNLKIYAQSEILEGEIYELKGSAVYLSESPKIIGAELRDGDILVSDKPEDFQITKANESTFEFAISRSDLEIGEHFFSIAFTFQDGFVLGDTTAVTVKKKPVTEPLPPKDPIKDPIVEKPELTGAGFYQIPGAGLSLNYDQKKYTLQGNISYKGEKPKISRITLKEDGNAIYTRLKDFHLVNESGSRIGFSVDMDISEGAHSYRLTVESENGGRVQSNVARITVNPKPREEPGTLSIQLRGVSTVCGIHIGDSFMGDVRELKNIELPRGDHRIKVTTPPYNFSSETTVTVYPGDNRSINIQLYKVSIAVRGEEIGAEIQINGMRVDDAPISDLLLLEGTYKIEAVGTSFEPKTVTIDRDKPVVFRQ